MPGTTTAIASAATTAAAAASLLYLNAYWSIPNDYRILRSLALARMRLARSEKTDRINLFYVLEEYGTSARSASLPFLVYEGQTWSFQETYETVLRHAAWLHHNQGVQAKEIVALDFVNSAEFVFLWLALWSLGAVPAFVNYNLRGRPLVHSVRVSTARLLIVDPEVAAQGLTAEVEEELTSPDFFSSSSSSTATVGDNFNSNDSESKALRIVRFTPTIQSSVRYQPPYRAPNSHRSTLPRSPAILIYTSGTTGLPKPAITSFSKLHIAGRFAGNWMGLRPATHSSPDRFYCCMPLYHSSGALLGFCNCLVHGTTFILGRRFSTRRFWPEVRASNATVLQYVGETCRYLLAAPAEPDPNPAGGNGSLDKAHQIRIAFGNGLRPDVWDRFKQRFGIETIAEFYTATEGTSGSCNYSSNSFAAGAVGRNGVIAGWLLRKQVCVVALDYESERLVRDPQREGLCVPVPRGEAGELLYALDAEDVAAKFQGYFGDGSASAKKVVRDVLVKGDAWFRTGDVLRWDSEGRWWFVDRIGDTFRWKSENVSTAEVSEVLGRFDGVVEANVYGVLVPGFEGRAGCAAVVLKRTRSEEEEMIMNEREKEALLSSLSTYLSTSLPRYSIPIFLRLVKQMQRTGNMKQQKHVLRTEGVDLDLVEGKYGEEIWWLGSMPATRGKTTKPKPKPKLELELELGSAGVEKKDEGEDNNDGARLLVGDGEGDGNADTEAEGRGAYVRFRKEDWEALLQGRVKL